MHLPTDAVLIFPGGGYKKIQRLHSSITRAFCHNIKEFSVWLGVKFVKHHAVGIETMFVTDIG